MLSAAFKTVTQNAPAVLIFIALYVPVATGTSYINHLVLMPMLEEMDDTPQWVNLARFGMDVGSALVIALAQTLAFTRLGREMDKPLWKVESDGDALARFYQLWLMITLLVFVTARFTNMAATRDPESGMVVGLLYLNLFVTVLAVPFGASVMFHGRFGLAEIRQGFRALTSEVSLTMGLLLFNFAFFIVIFVLYMSEGTPLWSYPIIQVGEAVADCFIFACTWYVCMLYRDRDDTEPDDIDL